MTSFISLSRVPKLSTNYRIKRKLKRIPQGRNDSMAGFWSCPPSPCLKSFIPVQGLGSRACRVVILLWTRSPSQWTGAAVRGVCCLITKVRSLFACLFRRLSLHALPLLLTPTSFSLPTVSWCTLSALAPCYHVFLASSASTIVNFSPVQSFFTIQSVVFSYTNRKC